MKQLFNFKRLIKKYSVPCELLAESASGSYVGGEWVPGVAAESKMINGAGKYVEPLFITYVNVPEPLVFTFPVQTAYLRTLPETPKMDFP